MKNPHLVACPSCARPVQVDESACPFCGGVLAASMRQTAPPEPPVVRLSRAALFACGAGAAALGPGCSSPSLMPPYGLPPFDDGGYVNIPAEAGEDATLSVDAGHGAPGPIADAAGDSGDGSTSLGDAGDGGPPVDEAGDDSGHD